MAGADGDAYTHVPSALATEWVQHKHQINQSMSEELPKEAFPETHYDLEVRWSLWYIRLTRFFSSPRHFLKHQTNRSSPEALSLMLMQLAVICIGGLSQLHQESSLASNLQKPRKLETWYQLGEGEEERQ